MTKSDEFPKWFVWIWGHGFLAFSAFLLIVMVAILTSGLITSHRLDDLEQQLTYQPPRQYEAPNLDAYAADDISSDSIVVEQSVYVPIYSHVYHGQGRPFSLEATLSIRNTDPEKPVYIRSVAYYDTNGELVQQHLDHLIRLKPLATIEFLVETRDSKGGSGANFIVHWLATEPVAEPIIEAVMVGTAGTQSMSFSRRGRPISRTGSTTGD